MPDIEDESGVPIEDESGVAIQDEATDAFQGSKSGAITPTGSRIRQLGVNRSTSGHF